MEEMPEIEEDAIENDFLFGVIKNLLNSIPFAPKIEEDAKIRIVQHHYDRPQENTSPYTPKIISIGPLHHGKPELLPLEKLKHRYLNDLLNRRYRYGMIPSPSRDGRNDEVLRRFIKAAREMEERVRSCYVLSNTISSDDFVKMLVIDGCFLLEFLIRSEAFVMMRMPLIKLDILLLENQIPFFVLEEFYEILLENQILFGERKTMMDSTTLLNIAFDYVNDESTTFFSYYDKWEKNFGKTLKDFLNNNHDGQINNWREPNLLHFYHHLISVKHHQQTSINLIRKWTMTIISWLFMMISYPMFLIHQLLFTKPLYRTRLTTAMELEEAGVRFQGSAMGLRFEQGTFFIPVLTLDDQNLCILKNLLAFEFYYPQLGYPVVHRYVALLFHLIKKPEDLLVLEKHHIIITSGGGEKSFRLVSDLLESGADYDLLESRGKTPHHHSSEVVSLDLKDILCFFVSRDQSQLDGFPRDALMAYCEKPHHRWRAKLMKDYFGSPWSILGIFVGVLLLVLTTLQTVFTVLSYYN